MSQKTTVVLLIVLALAVGYMFAWQYDFLGLGQKKAEPANNRLNETLIEKPPQVSDIVSLRLERPDQERLVAHYKDAKWSLIEPVQFEASSSVDKLVTMFSNLRILATYKPGEKGAPSDTAAGLKEPRAVLAMFDKSGAEYKLTVGSTDPLDPGQTYVRLGSDKTVYSVDADVMASLDVTPAKLRSLKLWDLADGKFRHIQLSGPKGATAVKSATDADWTVAVPRDNQPAIEVAADSDAVKKVTDALTSLKAEEWVAEKPSPEDLKLYGLDPAAVRVRMTVNKVTPPATQPADADLAVEFGISVGSSQYARIEGQPQVFKVAKSAVDSLNVAAKDLRDKRIAPLAAGDINELTLAYDDGRVARLIRDGSGWRMARPAESAADAKLVDGLADKVVAVKADSFDDNPTDARKKVLANPRLRITVQPAGGKPAFEVLVGPKSPLGATTIVGRSDLPAVADVKSELIDGLFIEPITLADKSVWKLNPDDVVAIERIAPAGKRAVERETADGAWRLTVPVQMAADAESVKSLLDKFVSLSAEQQTLLSAKDAGLDKPAATLVFTVLEAAPAATQPADTQPAEVERVRKRRTLVLAEKDGKLYCQTDGKPTVYLLRADLLSDATAELARKTLLSSDDRPDAAKADSLTLYSTVGEVDLVRQDEQWKFRKDASVEVDTIRVQEVINSVGGLSVIRYVDFDCKDPAKFGLNNPATRATVHMPADATATTSPADEEPGRTVTLLVSATGEDGGLYAMIKGSKVVGLVSPSDLVTKIQKKWEDFKKADTSTTTTPPMPSYPSDGEHED